MQPPNSVRIFAALREPLPSIFCDLSAKIIQNMSAAYPNRRPAGLNKLSRRGSIQAARRRLCTMIAVSAAGVTPSIRAACPSVSGRALVSRSTISRDNPPIAA